MVHSLASAAAFCALAAFSAAAETKTIDLLPGEYWWGGTVGGGWKMPLSEKSDYMKDLRVDSDGNQAAPLLLSTKGRWVWCEDAFKYTVKDGKLTVETGPAPRKGGAEQHPMDVNAAEGTSAREVAAKRGAKVDLIPNYEKTCYSKKTWAPIQTGAEKGGSLRAAFEHCSKTFFPPRGMPRVEWFQQPILNTWVELNYNQNEKDVLAYAKSFLAEGMKPGVFQIDCFWHTDAFGPWVFHGERFRDPKGLVRQMNDLGFRMILWYAPFVTLDSMPYRLLRANDGILKDARLRPYGRGYQGLPIAWWDGYSAVWDPTSPFGRQWNLDTMHRIMDDYGVEGFFFDGGGTYEYPPGDYIAYRNDAQPYDLCRAFQMMALEVPFGQCREAWKMGGLPLMQTLRDKAPKWSEMRRCITDMIAAGQLGYPFTVADLVGGGTCGNNGDGVHGLAWQDELFIRHLQIECLSPMVMFSGSPWRVLSPGAQEIVRKFIVLRERFAPRIVAIATETARTGIPMLRSMDFQYPGKGYELVLDQFMMGDELLVAPVVEGGVKTRKVVIPEGTWRADDNTVVVGPKTIEVETPLDRLPYFELVSSGKPKVSYMGGDGNGAVETAAKACALAEGGGRVADKAPDRLVTAKLHDVKMLGYAGRKADRFLAYRVQSAFAKEEIFGEAYRAIRDRNDDKTGVVGFWQGEFWGKLLMSAARTADYTRDRPLAGFVRDECRRLMGLQELDGYLASYRNREFVTGPDRNDKTQMEAVHKALGRNWDCDYCWNLWGRKYTMWGMLLAYDLTHDREILSSVERQMDQWIDMMHKLDRPLWKTGEPTYVGLPSMSVLKPLMCLYRETGKAKYLDYAREMLPYWERADGAAPNLVANTHRKEPIHAWYPQPDGWAKAYEMMSCLQGLLEYYRVTGERKYLDAVIAICRNIRDTERNQVGSVAYNDHFTDAIHRPNAVSEPCDVVHWMRLNHDLYLITGETEYVDEIELSYYNAMLGSLTRDGTWGARCVRSHGRNWHDLKGQCELRHQHCCVNNMPRGLMDVAQTFVTADRAGNLQVNLYSDADVTVAGAKVSIRGNFPVDNVVTVTVTGLAEGRKVDFRKPSWCPKMDTRIVTGASSPRDGADAGRVGYELTFDMNPRVVDWDMPHVDHDVERKNGYDRKVAQFTTYYAEKDMLPLVRNDPAATVMYGPLILAKSKLVGATREQVLDPFTANLKGYRASVERIPSDRVWGAWKVTLEKDGDRHAYPAADLGSACDTVTPYTTDEYSIWF